MMSQNDNQGKKPSQIEDSERFAFIALVLIFITMAILSLL